MTIRVGDRVRVVCPPSKPFGWHQALEGWTGVVVKVEDGPLGVEVCLDDFDEAGESTPFDRDELVYTS